MCSAGVGLTVSFVTDVQILPDFLTRRLLKIVCVSSGTQQETAASAASKFIACEVTTRTVAEPHYRHSEPNCFHKCA